MPILKSKSKRENYKLVGVSIPSQDHEFLTLVSLAKGISKTAIIMPFFNMIKDDSIETLLQEIIERIKVQWCLEKAKKNPITLSVFKSTLKKEFIRKGVSNTYVNQILKEIN